MEVYVISYLCDLGQIFYRENYLVWGFQTPKLESLCESGFKLSSSMQVLDVFLVWI